MRVLILGGTSEAASLARALAGDARFQATLSLAGRTRAPATPPVPHRIGGFGGIDGLAEYLRIERIDALIDATHPFAAQISRHAAVAAAQTATRLLVIWRPPWQQGRGDRWITVAGMRAAAEVLGRAPRRVFLTVGRQDLAPFAAAPWHHYLIRSVDPPDAAALPRHAEVIAARGPFAEADERRLLAQQRIEVIVTKNSGGNATVGKVDAARALGLPVVMVARPPAPAAGTVVADADAAHGWLLRLHGEKTAERGV